MTKTDYYDYAKYQYNARWFTAASLIFISVFPLTFLGVLFTLSYHPSVFIKIIVDASIVVGLILITYFIPLDSNFIKPKKRFNKQIDGTIKNKVLCKDRATFYLDNKEIVYSNERAYFELELEKTYTFMVIKKYHSIGIYYPIESKLS